MSLSEQLRSSRNARAEGDTYQPARVAQVSAARGALMRQRWRMSLALLIFACVLAGTHAQAQSFDKCRDQLFQGFVPRQILAKPGQQRALCFDSFAVLHSGQSKTPIYVAEHLTPGRIRDAQDEGRTNLFYEEARLPRTERATLDAYRWSGYDRGHMAPAADMPNAYAMAQSFSLANMVPQAPENNRGVWAKSVEKATRLYVLRGNEVYVFTGPIYSDRPRAIGRERVWVPDELFKLVYDPAKRRAWAFIVSNVDDARVHGVFSYADLVQRIGIEFLPTGAILPQPAPR